MENTHEVIFNITVVSRLKAWYRPVFPNQSSEKPL